LPGKAWLIENIGEEAYEVIWHPLLRIKFGDYYDKVSAAWIWHRIWRVARSRQRWWARESFGYLTHGSATLVDWLAKWLRAQPNVSVRCGVKVSGIDIADDRVTAIRLESGAVPCHAVISTVALPVLSRFVSDQRSAYFEKVRAVKYIGVVCALFNLKQAFSSSFWTNINDQRISFNGIIEQTNLNDNLKRAGLNLVYIPYYLPTTEERYAYTEEHLYREYTGMLKLVNPAFDERWVKDFFVSRTPFGQAICTTGFADLRPEHRTPVRGLYVTDSAQFYPEDRTLSAAIEQGRKAAGFCLEDAATWA
jgi:protoporphyrinogen oxidase